MRHQVWLAAVCAALAGASMADSPLRGDEGMWLFNNPPREQLKDKYGFEPTDEWLDHVQTVQRPVQLRRVRQLRLGRRPGDDQPPRRGRRPAEAVQREELPPRRLPRQDPRPRRSSARGWS